MRAIPTLSTFALALGLGILPAAAQDAPGDRPAPRPRAPMAGPLRERMEGRFEERLASSLKLTEAQRKSIEAIRARHREANEPRLKTLKDAQKAFAEALGKPDTPEAELKRLHQALSGLNFDLRMEHRAMRKEIREVLTPEQREKAARMEGRLEGRRMRRPGPMHGMGPGWDF
jgi:Spy/CpxP family protein refolding chaperone